MSRRVTGFFAKKIPKLDKKAKSNDKVEPTEGKPVEEQAPTPTVEHAPTPTTTTGEDAPQPAAQPVAAAVEETPVVKVTETAPPAPADAPVAPAAAATTTTTTTTATNN